jgi:hypothetical protein
MGIMQEMRQQAVTGIVAPQVGEALIREVFPSVAAHPAVASLGRTLTRTIIGAPVAWLLMVFFYFAKVLPGLGRRYTLTNRRLMIRRGIKRKPSWEVPLAEIDDVRVQLDANSDFFRAGNLEILSQGKVIATLPGVPEPESLRQSIINACKAWVPGKASGPFIPAKAAS